MNFILNEFSRSCFYSRIFLCLFLLMINIFFGCYQQLPHGIPKLYKTKITIVQDGKPLQGVSIIAINEDFGSSPWTAGGITNQAGIIELKTQGKYNGLPLGRYSITATKVETPADLVLPKNVNTDQEIREYDRILNEIQKNSFEVIDKKFRTQETTPLKIQVKPETNIFTFDLGISVREKVEANSQY